jgi:hypothetical protein
MYQMHLKAVIIVIIKAQWYGLGLSTDNDNIFFRLFSVNQSLVVVFV